MELRPENMMNRTRKALVMLGLIAVLAAPALAKEHRKKNKGEKVSWKNVPAAVQATIQSNTSGGKVVEVEKETKNGVVIYRAVVKDTDSKMSKVTVTDGGKLLKVKADDGRAKHKHKPLFGS